MVNLMENEDENNILSLVIIGCFVVVFVTASLFVEEHDILVLVMAGCIVLATAGGVGVSHLLAWRKARADTIALIESVMVNAEESLGYPPDAASMVDRAWPVRKIQSRVE